MKILWATPWNVDSAISRVSSMVVNALKKSGVEVTVVRTEDLLQVPGKPFPAPPLARLPFQLEAMENFDATVIHFGDHWPFHAKALEFLKVSPCIAVLHDATMLNFFLGRAHASGADAVQKLCDEGLCLYGPVPKASEMPTSANYDWAKSASEYWPFLHEVASKVDAVVVHSDHCLNGLPASCRDKVHVLMLPAFPTPQKRPPGSAWTNGKIHLCTIGHINENKRVASVLRAIDLCDQLKDKIIYTLAGPITDEQREPLESLAGELGFRGLRILGRVTDAEMSECLNSAHVICCLRHPTLEGASASVLEVLQYARPTLVTRAGFYHQIPEEFVWKVDPENEVAYIARHLKEICGDYAKALEKSAQSPAWVDANCRTEEYADQILALCDGLLPTKACAKAIHSLQAKALNPGGLIPGPLLNERISLVSQSLFKSKLPE